MTLSNYFLCLLIAIAAGCSATDFSGAVRASSKHQADQNAKQPGSSGDDVDLGTSGQGSEGSKGSDDESGGDGSKSDGDESDGDENDDENNGFENTPGEITPDGELIDDTEEFRKVRPLVACIHVVHGGSKNAADGMNKKNSTAYEVRCEVEIDLDELLTKKAIKNLDELRVSFASGVNETAKTGSQYPDQHKEVYYGDDAERELPVGEGRIECSADILDGVKHYCEEVGGTKSRYSWVQYNKNTNIITVGATRNGWGACRWKNHCYGVLAGIDLEFD